MNKAEKKWGSAFHILRLIWDYVLFMLRQRVSPNSFVHRKNADKDFRRAIEMEYNCNNNNKVKFNS